MANPSELTAKLPPVSGWGRMLSSRRGTIALAGVAGLAALGVLLLFMSNYRSSVQTGATEAKVLVAGQLIDEGTSGSVIAEAGLFQSTTLAEEDALDGAIADPSALEGQVVTEPIYKGQQLTAAALRPGSDPIAGELTGTQRALSVPVSAAQGNLGQIEAGSRIDVIGKFDAELSGGRVQPVVNVLARDVLVMKVPPSDGGGIGASDSTAVVLRVSDEDASRIALSAESGEIWFTVRPPTLGEDSKAKPVQFEDLLKPATSPNGGSR